MSSRPALITFDVFGTVLDWRTGLCVACGAMGRPLEADEFDRIVDAQGSLEQGDYLTYADVTSLSLMNVVGLPEATAIEIGVGVGRWPLFDDAAALSDLMKAAPCCGMTNSDLSHGDDVQEQLGFKLDDWLCAEQTRVYKPNPDFWLQMSRRRRIEPGPSWWHVSAYADYDLEVANALGLTTIFVDRPHSRPGPASHAVRDLNGLLALLEA